MWVLRSIKIIKKEWKRNTMLPRVAIVGIGFSPFRLIPPDISFYAGDGSELYWTAYGRDAKSLLLDMLL